MFRPGGRYFRLMGFSPTQIAGLTLWLDSGLEAAGALTTWTDRSVNGYDGSGTATNGTATQNGRRLLRFNGTTDKMITPAVDWTAVNAFTLIFVAKASSSAASQSFFEKGFSAYPFASSGHYVILDSSGPKLDSVDYNAGNLFNEKGATDDPCTTLAVRSVRLDRSRTGSAGAVMQSHHRDCGICVDPVAWGGLPTINGLLNSAFYLGVRGDGTSLPLAGDYGEVILYSGWLSDADLLTAEQYAAHKWRLPYRSIFPLGDSITYGEATQDGWRGPLCDANLDILAARGNVTVPAGGVYPCEGHPGAKIADINTNVAGYWTSARGSEILLTIGTNDALTPADRAGMLTAYDTLLTTLEALAPAPSIIWCATLTPLLDGDSNTAVNAFNAGLAAVVAGHATARYVDVGSCLTTADLGDGIHPTIAGYNKMATRWSSVLGGLHAA